MQNETTKALLALTGCVSDEGVLIAVTTLNERGRIYDQMLTDALRSSPRLEKLPLPEQDGLCFAKWASLPADEAHEIFADLISGSDRIVGMMQQFRMEEVMTVFAQLLSWQEREHDSLGIQEDMNKAAREIHETRLMEADEIRRAS